MRLGRGRKTCRLKGSGRAARLPKRLPAGMADSAPPNVTFTGWLQYPRFLGELAIADVVVAFSLDPGIMNRAAFEAVALGRSLVLSDWAGLRDRFGDAARYCAPSAGAMAEAIRSTLDAARDMAGAVSDAHTRLARQHENGIGVLRAQLAAGRIRSKRVLLISQHPLPDNPTLRRNVEHLLRRGADLDILVMNGTKEWRPPDGSRLRVWKGHLVHRRDSRLRYLLEYLTFFVWASLIVTWLSLTSRYDTVQVDNLPDFLVFAALPARLRGARLVLFMFELMPEMTMARLGSPSDHPMVRLSRLQERLAVRWADSAIVVNEPCRVALVARGLDGGRIRIVPNTQPTDTLPVAPARASHEGAPRLVTHATLIWRYGVQIAVQAVVILRRRWPAIRLEVLGDGEHLPALRTLTTELELDGTVFFHGHLRLPMKLLDYAAMSVPAVVSRLPTIEFYFSDKAVSYFEPGDPAGLAAAISTLLEDPARARLQVEQATIALRKLSWDEGVSAVYDKALFA